MKKIIICLLLLSLQLNSNPIENFNAKFPFNSKKLLITIDIQDCLGCSIPISEIVNEIHKQNQYIPIFLITNDSLNDLSKEMYLKKLKISNSIANLVSDKKLYQNLITKSKGEKNITVVHNSKIEFMTVIRSELNIKKILKYFDSNFIYKINDVYALSNEFTDFAIYNGAVFNKKNFVLFKKGINIVSKYNYENNVHSTILLDTFSVFDINFAKNILTSSEFEKCKNNYKNNEIKNYIRPATIFRIDESAFGINCYLKSYIDSIYNGELALFEFETCFVIVLDTNLKYQKIIKFNNTHSKDLILESGAKLSDTAFYYLGSDSDTLNKYFVTGFNFENGVLNSPQQNKFYFNKKKKDLMPSFCQGQQDVLILFNQNRRNKTCKILRKNHLNQYTFEYNIKNKHVYSSLVFKTPSDNIIYGFKDKNGLNFDALLSECKENKSYAGVFHFVFQSKLFRIDFLESKQTTPNSK